MWPFHVMGRLKKERVQHMKKRSLFWDNFKGILIFLVVFGHFIYAYANDLPDSIAHDIYIFIYAFHMPAFVFCSGYFSKSQNARSTASLIKLALYYVVFNTLMAFFAHFYMGTKLKFLTPYYSYWYMLSLIVWRALVGRLGKVKGIVVLSVIISLAVGYISDFSNILSVRRTVAFFVFFVAGYLLDREKVERFLDGRKGWRTILGVITALLVFAAIFQATVHFEVTEGMTLMSTYGKKSNYLHRILVLILASAAIISMFLAVPNRKIPLVSKFGQNSLLIYLAHRFVTLIFYRDIFPAKSYSDIYLVYALLATVVTCIVLGSDKLNRLVAAGVDRATTAISDPDSKTGTWIITTVVLVFIIMLCMKAAPQIK